jgi:hypothetical protein
MIAIVAVLQPHFCCSCGVDGAGGTRYGRHVHEHGISALARNHIYHINKETFLPAFKAAYELTLTEENACAGFRGAGLVPFNPDAVLSKLDVRLRTPTPLQRDDAAQR